MTAVSICVCTYRRPELVETLGSLRDLDLPEGLRAEVVVIDNDDTPTAREVAVEAGSSEFQVRYVHAPSGNISIARNAALDAASHRFLAFIDDDEIASPGWLAALLARQDETGADVVLGPVSAVYDETAPGWMRATSLHATAPVFADGEIRTGYSGNVLIDRHSPAMAGLRFDLSLGKTGGEDTMFFAAAHHAGAKFAFAPYAAVSEAVPPARTSMRWLAERKLRSGRTHARLLLEIERRNRLAALALASAKAVYCAVGVLASLPLQTRRSLMTLRFLFHTGVVAGLAATRSPDRPNPLMKVAKQ